ncbi:S41 family peptidase [Marinicella sp. W31]|uniref:S41 family peptidase n=1 Tax=Marinicella sp. W31 TaxID=3023713 RepID=UPI0037580C27
MMRNFLFKFILIAQVLVYVNAPVAAQTLSDQDKIALLESMMKAISNQYVLKEKVDEINAHIKSLLNDPEIKKIKNPNRLATYLSEQITQFDGHFRVSWRKPGKAEQPEPGESWGERAVRNNHGFKQLHHLTGNIAYLDLRFFDGSDAAKKRADSVMSWMADSTAVIIDLRENGGGSPGMVQYICSYFFSPETKVHLNSIYNRPSDSTTEFWTLQDLPGKFMPEVPLYVLTSARTASAAEEFAYNMKTRKRATLIGEVTAGGANPGGDVDLVSGFSMFVSTGMAINPVTQKNWEGTGVQPDKATSAEDALDTAYEMALLAVQEISDNRWQQQEINWKLEKMRSQSAVVDQPEQYAHQFGRIQIVLKEGDLYYKRGRRPAKKMHPINTDYFALKDSDGVRLRFIRNQADQAIHSIAIQYVDGREQRYPIDQE